jgi:L-threonylcarbamoyladenylate synthase
MATATDIANAVRVLASQGLVAFPTETVYGLGADAESALAVERIYRAKGRPSNHPVIVHVTPEADLLYWAASVPPEAQLLIDAFWPGPLTLILKRAKNISSLVSGGQDSIGLRCPSHPVAQALLRGFAATRTSGQGGVAAPSANKFGQVSPTSADHVRSEFAELVSQGMPVLEGGASDVGIESTIVDCSTKTPIVLRPGGISAEDIQAVVELGFDDVGLSRAPGMLPAHYAPNCEVILLDDLSEANRLKQSFDQSTFRMIDASIDPLRFASTMYAQLRQCDAEGIKKLCVMLPEPLGIGLAIRDRLTKAALGSKNQSH